MNWTHTYRLALWLLPAALRRKHGASMEGLFVRELGRARAHGRLRGALAGAVGVWDVVRRGAYEHLRLALRFEGEARDHSSPDEWNIDTHSPQPAGADLGDPLMPQPARQQILRRHAFSFAFAFVALTLLLLVLDAWKQVPMLSARGVPSSTIVELLLLAVPYTVALTIPMAVLVAVLYEFTRLGVAGTLAAARRERGGFRRLVVPVIGAAVGVAALALVINSEIVPRANARLSAVLITMSAGRSAVSTAPALPKGDREMTIGELREAMRDVRLRAGAVDLQRSAAYEVEIQKKLALAAACVVMALLGVAVAHRVPRGGMGLVIGVSCAVFSMYYVMLVTGERLADQLVVSPFVAMWAANALLLLAALLAVWRRRPPFTSRGRAALATRG